MRSAVDRPLLGPLGYSETSHGQWSHGAISEPIAAISPSGLSGNLNDNDELLDSTPQVLCEPILKCCDDEKDFLALPFSSFLRAYLEVFATMRMS